MHRRSFLKTTVLTSAGVMMLPAAASPSTGGAAPVTLEQLERNFELPPDVAKPWVFYMWMNGHVTQRGITLDLEAMQRMGIGGAICFNSAVGIARGPVDYAGAQWLDAVAHMVREARRLGLRLSLHNSPGYSGCGGPWIPPELSMQQLVWTEAYCQSDGRIVRKLDHPYAKHGYYRDAMVIAYPSLVVERGTMRERLLSIHLNGTEIDKDLLTDGNPETRIRVNSAGTIVVARGEEMPDLEQADAAHGGAPSVLVLAFDAPYEARAITILRKAEVPRDLFDGDRDHPPVFLLEASDDGKQYSRIGNVACSQLREMDAPSTLSFPAVTARYYRLSTTAPTWIADVQLHSGPRLAGWQGKTNNTRASSSGTTPAVESALLIDPAQVRDVTCSMRPDGLLDWAAPAGRWTILRIGHTTTGESPAAAPDAGRGLEIDKFSRKALDQHFTAFLDVVMQRLGSEVGATLSGITVDSYEAGKQNWTADFPGEFRARKYDLMRWMPAMTGRIVAQVEQTERFLWDVRKVQADLLSENFYGYYAERCHRLGLEFSAEPYGDGNLDSLQIGSHLDVPMSEFWTRYMYGSDTTSKQAASIAHAYGKSIVAAESFTAMPEHARWSDYPYSLKAEGDYFYSLGVNRLVFHTFVHQPYSTGRPGMTMGPFGMHVDRHNTWTEQAHAWTRYLQRSQYLLQHGKAVVDLCYFKGDEPESGVPDLYKFMPYGYAGDVIGADVLHHRVRIEQGRLKLPDGMSYRLCMMAPLAAILPATVRRLRDLVHDGMVLVVQNKPAAAAGQGGDAEVAALLAELYGELDGVHAREHRLGAGKVLWGLPLPDVLKLLDIPPDFQFRAQRPDAAIHYLHKTTADCEYYFISNHRRRAEVLEISLRSGARQPEIWHAETGKRQLCGGWDMVDGRLVMPLLLDPAGAVFVVLRAPASAPGPVAMLRDGAMPDWFAPQTSAKAMAAPYPDVTHDFTIGLWLKPDSTARSGRSMLFHPPSGAAAYGAGHVACGMSAGQNGVRVYESGVASTEVLFAAQAVSGWSHVVLVYRAGAPSIYIDGKLAAVGKPSSAIVHPGLETAVTPAHYTTFFEGNHTDPVLTRSALSPKQVLTLFAQGLPVPVMPDLPACIRTAHGRLAVLAWENGRYRIGRARHRDHHVTGCHQRAITGAWDVRLAPDSGTPSRLSLPELRSLRLHSHADVRHYAGTAVYLKSITITGQEMRQGRRIYLDLGRVEVIAELKVNGQAVAVLWKEPFMADITSFIKAGRNQLEIAVTTLWQNRLIGDEQLPQEQQYSRHGYVRQLPEWYLHEAPKPGARKAFSVWKHVTAGDPLLESGLLGPVRLLMPVEILI